MMAQANPFRTRHSETAARDLNVFTSTFGVEMFSIVPPPPFQQLYVIRSAPGAGKTSLMRALTAETLKHVHDHRSRLANLHSYLREFGVLDDVGPRVLGVLVNLQQGFLGLEDVDARQDARLKLLFRLIDARLMSGFVRAALTLRGLDPDANAARVGVETSSDSGAEALARLGGGSGDELINYARQTESEVLDLFDRLVVREGDLPSGHAHLYTLSALSGATVYVDGEVLDAEPLFMLDDGHALSNEQREALLKELSNRNITVGRWLAVRAVALTDDELLGAGDEGRDYDVIEIEAFTRESTTSGKAVRRLVGQSLTHGRFQKMLLDIADRRAQPTLSRILADSRTLTDLLTLEPDAILGSREDKILETLRQRLWKKTDGSARYVEWIESTDKLRGREGMARLAELEVLIQRDMDRAQGDLFEEMLPLTREDAAQRGSSGLREAALLRASLELGVPYYVGASTFTRLGSANIEQFLEICGDLTARILQQDAVGRSIRLSAEIQDQVAREASDRYWNSLAQLPDGDVLQRFVDRIAAISALEAAKPRLPYPPGVTGTALTMADRMRLRSPHVRANLAGADDLYNALVAAIAHNVVWIELDYSVKHDRWMVIYLNRLLCPRYKMPLNLGGFRERKLVDMAGWFVDSGRRMPTQDLLL